MTNEETEIWLAQAEVGRYPGSSEAHSENGVGRYFYRNVLLTCSSIPKPNYNSLPAAC